MSKSDQTQGRVLQFLKDKKGAYVSGAMLASELGLSRTGIWKQIQSLRSQGYEILSHPKDGYSLVEEPDAPLPEEILANLETSWMARSYHYLLQIGSTNDYAMQLALNGAPHGTLVVAEEQTKGRGRLKRQWVSPPNCGLYMSILLTDPLPTREASHATSVAALALAKVLRERYHLEALIKWPNDILIGHSKVAGILTEMQSDQDFTRFLVIGIGINVNHGQEDLAGPFRYPATSIAMELGSTIKRQHLLLQFLHQFETEYERFTNEGFSALLPEIEQVSGILGRHVTIRCGDAENSGKALRFTSEGALILQSDDGSEETIWVGDVTQVERKI
jgi:BirA family transcriptional regulator, biotin operon repressor / biotin---[acetyl-CoA-carboxylase] ligase